MTEPAKTSTEAKKDTATPPAPAATATPAAPATSPEAPKDAQPEAAPAKPSFKEKLAAVLGKLKLLLKRKKTEPSEPPAPKPKRKPIGMSFQEIIAETFAIPLLIIRGGFGTKLVALGFLASVAAVAYTGSLLLDRWVPKDLAKSLAKSKTQDSNNKSDMNAFFERSREIALAKDSMIFLETFSTPITAQIANVRYLQFELYAECESPTTAKAVKAKLAALRDKISGSIQGLAYEDLKTLEGKESLKSKLLDVINDYLDKHAIDGKVNRVFFTSLVFGR